MSLILLFSGYSGAGTPAPTTPPPVGPAPLNVRARIYDGSALTGGIFTAPADPRNANARGSAVNNGNFWTASGYGTDLDFSYPVAPRHSMLAAVALDNKTETITATGWTLIRDESHASANIRIAVYRKTAGGSESADQSFSLSAAANWTVSYSEFVGVGAGAGTSAAASATVNVGGMYPVAYRSGQVTPTSANEMVLSFFAFPNTETFGYYPPKPTGFEPMAHFAHNAALMLASFQRYVNTTAAVNPQLTSRQTSAYLGVTVTLPGTSVTRFDPIGELDAATGRGAVNAVDITEFELHVPASEPCYHRIRENTIVEFFVDEPASVNSWTFNWYVVRSVQIVAGETSPVKVVRGQDLRCLVGHRPLQRVLMTVVSGRASPPPAGNPTEEWVRAYIDAACITVPSSAAWYAGSAAASAVPTLRLETRPGPYRGRLWTNENQPGRPETALGDSIASMLQMEGMGWRVVVKDAGTTNGALEVQIFEGVNRTLGRGGEVVFASQWDTAERSEWFLDAVDAVTGLIALGPAAEDGTRPTLFRFDAGARAQWGLILGTLDAGNRPLTNDMIDAALRERLPRSWVEVVPALTARSRLGTNYNLLDVCTALSVDGQRFDAAVTEVEVAIGGEVNPVFDTFLPPTPAGAATAPTTGSGTSRVARGAATIVLGERPIPGLRPRDSSDAALRLYAAPPEES